MNQPPLAVGMLLYPGFTMLDLVGPLTVFTMHSHLLLFWKTLEPVASDAGISIVPTHTLQDCRATTHWAMHGMLSQVGAIPEKARVVTDRNRISGGGVTAGIDFALTVLAHLRGRMWQRQFS